MKRGSPDKVSENQGGSLGSVAPMFWEEELHLSLITRGPFPSSSSSSWADSVEHLWYQSLYRGTLLSYKHAHCHAQTYAKMINIHIHMHLQRHKHTHSYAAGRGLTTITAQWNIFRLERCRITLQSDDKYAVSTVINLVPLPFSACRHGGVQGMGVVATERGHAD